jgi:hypothetical protein
MVTSLKDSGLWGIECYSNSSNSASVYDIMKLAKDIGLYVTAGSDFHGYVDHNNIGIMTSDDILPWARFCGGL